MKSIFPIICLAFIFSAEANQDKNKYWNWNKIAVSWFPGGDTIKSVSEVTLVNLQGESMSVHFLYAPIPAVITASK